MQFKNLVVAALASVVSATNTVTLKSMDSTDRTVVWTGTTEVDDTSVPGGESVNVTLPDGWTGNAYSYNSGASNTPGMLAEFAFNSYAGATYFDVSAIVNPDDTTGVYQMYPADTASPMSGCMTFACSNAYYLPDDVQTKSTTSSTIIVTLGAGEFEVSSKRDAGENHPREALTDPYYKPTLKGRFTSALRWARRGEN
ncbi:hypothetical protein N0V93_006399 [Gnomoniopsis smithogilvyi]|uniref:Extracellular protein n=1 Tax=Gnomoniopsis smithogilvyi TaxID=1191159 RepID=A0A9W8YPL8_9PEZI|nr:hypothetical protein N0V93_006399 [Gnomoniopsis smithogilvyi]